MPDDTNTGTGVGTGQQAQHPLDRLFVNGRMQLAVTPEMQDNARAVAMLMDKAVRYDRDGRSSVQILHETLAPDREYREVFAQLLHAAIAANPELKVKKYQLIGPPRPPDPNRPVNDRNVTTNEAIVQFTANMRLATIDALDGLIIDEATVIKQRDYDFNVSTEYAPKQRDIRGNIMMPQGHHETGIPYRHQMQVQFTDDVFKMEREMHKASKAVRHGGGHSDGGKGGGRR